MVTDLRRNHHFRRIAGIAGDLAICAVKHRDCKVRLRRYRACGSGNRDHRLGRDCFFCDLKALGIFPDRVLGMIEMELVAVTDADLLCAPTTVCVRCQNRKLLLLRQIIYRDPHTGNAGSVLIRHHTFHTAHRVHQCLRGEGYPVGLSIGLGIAALHAVDRQQRTGGEAVAANGGNPFTDPNLLQRAAVSEAPRTNGCQALRQNNFSQTAAVAKRIIGNGYNAFRDFQPGQLGAADEDRAAVVIGRTPAGMFGGTFRPALGIIHSGQLDAAVKYPVAQRAHAIRQVQLRQTGAVLEAVMPNGRQALRQGHRRNAGTTAEGTHANAARALSHGDASQTAAALKGIVRDRGQTSRQLHANQTLAALERIAAHLHQAFVQTDLPQARTILEGIAADLLQRFREINTHKAGAALERIGSNDLQPAVFRKADHIQVFIVLERTDTNGLQAGRQHDLFQIRIAAQGIIRQRRHSFGKLHGFQTGAALEHITAVVVGRAPAGVLTGTFRPAQRQTYRRQCRTIGKYTSAKGRHAVRDGDRLQPGAVLERVMPNRCQAVRQADLLQALAATEGHHIDFLRTFHHDRFQLAAAVKAALGNHGHGFGNGDLRQRCTAGKDIGAEGTDSFGQFHRCQRRAAAESVALDGRHLRTLGEGYGFQPGAVQEGTAANGLQTGRQHDLFQIRIAAQGIVRQCRHSFGKLHGFQTGTALEHITAVIVGRAPGGVLTDALRPAQRQANRRQCRTIGKYTTAQGCH